MADEPTPPTAPPTSPSAHTPTTIEHGRCHWCGYDLRGLPGLGKCPECGTDYTYTTTQKLKPWPGAGMICLRLGWPLLGLALAALLQALVPAADGIVLLYGYPMLVAVPINSYFQVRSMLKKSLPEQKRTQGTIKGLRVAGTTIAVIVFLLTISPIVFFIGCLVVLAGGGF